MPEFKVAIKMQALPGVKLPARATHGSAGYDLCSACETVIPAGKFAMVSTGISISMPEGLEAQVRPRSGLAARHGVTVLNSPGTIDSDYRGEICVIMINHGPDDFKIEPGMRIAQLVFSKVINVSFDEREDLDNSERGAGGFGSTGTK
ncbi:MAG: dUTP pyrophosphatase [Clostridiales bacterium]|jgi:dUTP pyrophosphatase|nr:dUTP pyrophosphatase [Clostridiales bacterium]MDN5282177.1 dUTP pyrophosphatase [Candidatus Ozemobacter sp.]